MEQEELFDPSVEPEFRQMPKTTNQKRKEAYEEMERTWVWRVYSNLKENISN